MTTPKISLIRLEGTALRVEPLEPTQRLIRDAERTLLELAKEGRIAGAKPGERVFVAIEVAQEA